MAHQSLVYVQPSTPPIGVRTPGETRARAHARGTCSSRAFQTQFANPSPPCLAYILSLKYTFNHPYPALSYIYQDLGKGQQVIEGEGYVCQVPAMEDHFEALPLRKPKAPQP